MNSAAKLFNRQTISAFLLGVALAVGVGAYAVERHMGGPRGAMNADSRAEHMLKRLYAEVGATDAQKAAIEPLVKAAMQDLKPLHEQLGQAHKQAIQLLSQPTIARDALEAARVQDMALVDQASKRLVRLMADVGETLSPTQRQKLADHLGKMHGGRGHGGGL